MVASGPLVVAPPPGLAAPAHGRPRPAPRSPRPIPPSQDLGLVVTQMGGSVANVTNQEPVAQVWPTPVASANAEVLASDPDKGYLLLPFTLGPRAGDLEYTLAVYSANPVKLRPLEYDPAALTTGLHLSIAMAEPAQEMFPGGWLHLVQRQGGVFVLVINTSAQDSVQVEVHPPPPF